jgi:hypothetical protein
MLGLNQFDFCTKKIKRSIDVNFFGCEIFALEKVDSPFPSFPTLELCYTRITLKVEKTEILF